MRRPEYDEMTAGHQVVGRRGEFRRVVGDMLEHVEIEDRVVERRRIDVPEGSDLRPAARRQGAPLDPLADPCRAIAMIGRLLRPASIIKLAATTMTMVCSRMIIKSPTTVVAHPGIARLEAKRTIAIARIPRSDAAAIMPEVSSTRTKIVSICTDIALSPWTINDTRLIRDRPS